MNRDKHRQHAAGWIVPHVKPVDGRSHLMRLNMAGEVQLAQVVVVTNG